MLPAASALIDHVLKTVPKHPTVDRIYLHVQTNNEAALTFYRRYGFDVEETLKDYYKRLDPSDCYVLSKAVVPAGDVDGDAAGAGAGAAAPAAGAGAPASS